MLIPDDLLHADIWTRISDCQYCCDALKVKVVISEFGLFELREISGDDVIASSYDWTDILARIYHVTYMDS